MWPSKAQYRPGEEVVLHAPGAFRVIIRANGHAVAGLAVADDQVTLTAPEVPAGTARGFRAEAVDRQGQMIASTAFDVAHHWSAAPRYGFLSNFKPTDKADGVSIMNRLHLNVAQFYDWMYTHYQYFAPTPEFVDPLGRTNSHTVVQAKIDACHQYGIACLAYGSMYGGEKPIALAHPEWQLYAGNGKPLELIDLFYIQNVEKGCGWRDLILGQYEEAVKRLGFDGIHIDQYGFPKRALFKPAPGVERVVDMTTAMVDFVAEACERIARVKPAGGNIFNCVNNWPVEQMATVTTDAATYIEVWEPHTTYRDLHELVRHARSVRPGKQVVLAAYLKPFHPVHGEKAAAPASERPLNALRLATAAIHAAGGFHLLLGEGDAVLTESYYPTHTHLSEAELATVQQYYDFITANTELLHDPTLRDVSYTWNDGGFGDQGHETGYKAPVALTPMAEPGKVWTVLKEQPGRRVVHLINLNGLTHSSWNEPQPNPEPVDGIEVTLQCFSPIQAIWYASPDDGGQPRQLRVAPAPDGRPYVTVTVPRLHFWGMLWTEE